MLQLRLTRFLLIYYLTEIGESSPSEEHQVVTSFNGLQNDYNFGHVGYVHLDSDLEVPNLELSSCTAYDVNKTTCDFLRRSATNPDADVMVLRAWTATTLRDNILVLFGYLLHQRTSRAFSRAIRTSLRLLYKEVRSNGVNVMDFVPRLGVLEKVNQIGQVIWLVRSLDRSGPAYCRSAVAELSKYFRKRRELLKSILSAQREINLLADIGVQMIPNLRLNDKVKRPFDQNVADTLGQEFAAFFGGIQNGGIALTQPVVAAFLLNMKFDAMTPSEIEKFRFLCDLLRLNKVPNWSPDVIGACCENYKDPYALVDTIMKSISRRIKADSMIKKTVDDLIPRIVKEPRADVRTTRMNNFFGNSNFNISLFLDVLEDEAKIPQVRQFRKMVRNRTIDLSYGLKGFIRFFYDSPRLIAIALLERLRYRVPMARPVSMVVDLILGYLHGLDETEFELEG